MSSELERRLERALGEAPGPDPGVTDRALRSALEALPSPGEARRIRRRRIALLLAACMAAFVSGGVTLAATGAHLPVVNPEPAKKTTRSGPRFPAAGLPAGTSIWAVAGGRVVVVTKQTPIRRLHGERVVAFSASPGSLYAVEGRGGDAARARDPRAAGRVGPSQPRRPACGRRLVTVPDSDRLPASHGERLHGRRPLGHRHASVHGRHDSRAGDAHLAVELEGAGLRERIRRSRGPRRHRRCEPVAPTGMRDTAAGCDRVRSAGRLARGRRPGGARGPGRHVGRTGRPLPGRGRRPAPSSAWLGRSDLLVAAGSSLSRYAVSGPEAQSRTVMTALPIDGPRRLAGSWPHRRPAAQPDRHDARRHGPAKPARRRRRPLPSTTR